MDFFDEILADENTITVRVINDKNIDMVRKIRNSKYNSKVRSVDDNYE